MPKHRLFACGVLLTAMLFPAVATAQPRLDFSCDQIAAGPLPSQIRQQVDEFVSHWCGVMAQTDTDAEVVEARNRLVEGFGKCPDSAQYQTAYATAVVDSIRPSLASEDLLRQVNAALVVANTRNMRVRPVLDEMVRHNNPAVRYLGWQGYQRVRTLVLAQGQGYSRPMFESLSERIATETTPFVTRRLLEMLYLPPVRPQVVSEGDYSWARRQAMEAMLKGWSEQCRRILLGEPEMPDAMRPGVWAISTFHRATGSDRDAQSKLVQALVDVMYCASRAYDEAGDDATGDRVRHANTMLLTDAEEHLNELTELRRDHVYRALRDEGVPDRGAQVRRGVLDWVDDLIEAGFEIEQPSFEPPQSNNNSD